MKSSLDEPAVTVLFVDVGHGDCTVVINELNKEALVIDCPPGGVDAVLSALRDVHIDTIIVTHLDLDHYGGIVKLVDRSGGCRAVRMVPLVNLSRQNYIKAQAFAREIARILRSGATGEWMIAGYGGDHGAVHWTCLAPELVHGVEALVTTNNRASIVLLIELAGLRILIGSDADGVVWRDLIAAHTDIRADILRYPHHGAPLPSGATLASLHELMEAVQPTHVVLSIGERVRYGHPRVEVIEGLIKANAIVLCTRSTALCNAGKRSDRACAGTIKVYWKSSEWALTPSPEIHAQNINDLPTPACRISLHGTTRGGKA